jgi:CubicO group peptidase (beta-lactamase class C family)
MKGIVDDPLLFQPGTKMQYTTLGFTVLGAAAEAIAGKSFDVLAQEFFSGHNLNTIVVDNPFWIVRRRVRGYRFGANGGFENAPFFDPSNKYPGGGFLGSAEDCVRFLIAVNTGEILQPPVVQQMWTPQTLNDGKATTYGLGWGAGKRNGYRRVGHYGLQPGTTTVMQLFPDLGVAVVLLCNAEGPELDGLLEAVLTVLLPQGNWNYPRQR